MQKKEFFWYFEVSSPTDRRLTWILNQLREELREHWTTLNDIDWIGITKSASILIQLHYTRSDFKYSKTFRAARKLSFSLLDSNSHRYLHPCAVFLSSGRSGKFENFNPLVVSDALNGGWLNMSVHSTRLFCSRPLPWKCRLYFAVTGWWSELWTFNFFLSIHYILYSEFDRILCTFFVSS